MNKIYTEINSRTNGKFENVRFPRVELSDGKVKELLNGASVKKVIVIPNRLINVII